jgi:hypothetical protein
MRRERIALLLLLFAPAQVACSSTDTPPEGPEEPSPEGTCAEEAMHGHPELLDYSAGLEFTTDKGVKVTLVSSAPAPPTVGDNVWTLKVSVNGTVPDDLSIAVSPKMPDHGHFTTVTPIVTDGGNGIFVVDPVHFQMAGFWETRIDVEAGDVTDTVRVPFCAE